MFTVEVYAAVRQFVFNQVAAEPVVHFSVAFVVRIGEGFEHFLVAPGTTDVLRRPPVGGPQETGIGQSERGRLVNLRRGPS